MKQTIFINLITLLFGLAVGFGVSRAFSGSTQTMEPTAAKVATAGARPLSPSANDLAAQVASQNAELAQRDRREIELINRVDALERALAEAEQLAASAPPAEPVRPQWENRRAERQQQQLEREAATLTARLNLHASQAAALETAFQLRTEARAAWFEARRNGMDSILDPEAIFRDELGGFLTPEQLDTYDQFEESVILGRAETGATARMNAIAPDLGLDEAQKDAVFATFYEDLATRRLPDAPSGEVRQTQLRAEMERILTPQQFERWESLESQGGNRFFRGP